jgi:hypothetical protein
MLELNGGTHYLLLSRDGTNGHLVHSTRRFADALSKWDSGTRISPIYGLNGADAPEIGSQNEQTWLLFFGPTYPGGINPEGLGPIYITQGIYDIIVYSTTTAQRQAALAQVRALRVAWEEWELSGHRLRKVRISPRDRHPIPPQYLVPLGSLPAALTPSAREYAVLTATAIARFQDYLPQAAVELGTFDRGFRSVVLGQDVNDLDKQAQLVNANAAISRQSSQTFAGVSPIVETECHFWTHSLLGVGIPSMALMTIRRFVATVFSQAKFFSRLDALQDVAEPRNLLNEPASSDYWDTEHLYNPAVESRIAMAGPDEFLPLMTCYSGRDGFRSTRLSLSAPLEVITSCNTTVWTLLTLTHELSHTLLDGALSDKLLPNPSRQDALDRAVDLLARRRVPASVMENLQRFMCHSLWALDRGQEHQTEELSAEDLATVLRRRWLELNELMTHVFDFLYFYQKDDEAYVRVIWASWGVIPNIQPRVGDYIVRTLCAIYVKFMRTAQGIDKAIERTLELMTATAEKFPNDLIRSAVGQLKGDPSYFRSALQSRIPFVKVVRGFLYQPRIAQLLFRESAVGSGEREGYDLTPKSFDTQRVTNPLRFISAYRRPAALAQRPCPTDVPRRQGSINRTPSRPSRKSTRSGYTDLWPHARC